MRIGYGIGLVGLIGALLATVAGPAAAAPGAPGTRAPGRVAAAPADTPASPVWSPDRVAAGLTQAWPPSPLASQRDPRGQAVETDGIVVGTYSNGQEVGVDEATGAIRWTWWANEFAIPIGAGDGRIFILDGNGLEALDASTGTLLWTYQGPDDEQGGGGVVDGVPYMSIDNLQDLVALDPATGAVRWTAPGLGGGNTLKSQDSVNAVDGAAGKLYAEGVDAAGGATLVGVNPATGAVLWTDPLPSGYSTTIDRPMLALSSGRVLVQTAGSPPAEWVYDGATGAPVWVRYLEGSDRGETVSGRTSADGVLYVVTNNGDEPAPTSTTWAIDEATGRPLWIAALTGVFLFGNPGTAPAVLLTTCAFPGSRTDVYLCGVARADGRPLSSIHLGVDVEDLTETGTPTVAGADVITSVGGDALAAVTPAALLPVPGKIQAESTLSPALTAPAEDTGGTDLVGLFPPGGAVLDYPVDIAAAGSYQVTFRVASDGASLSPPISPKLQLQLFGVGTLASVDLPQTGGWQTWRSVSTTVTLPAGVHRLRIYIPAGSQAFNINWFDVEPAAGAGARAAVRASSAAQRRSSCTAGLRPSARLPAAQLAAACFGS